MNIIEPDYSNLETYIINLHNYIDNYIKQKPFLESIGLTPHRFIGVNATQNEHLYSNYRKHISNFTLEFTPKSVIGCGLSHILCCKHIYNNILSNCKDNTFFLIMEDDAYPKYDKKIFYDLLNKNLNDIILLDPNWEIIQLHSDGFINTNKTYITHYFCGSTAAYLISKKGIEKMSNAHIKGHLDFVTQNFISFRKYRVKDNLFYTDEKHSLNRVISNKINLYNLSLYLKSKIIEKFGIKIRGEKSFSNYLEFKLIKLPFFKKEYTANEFIDILLGLFVIKKLIKYVK